MEFITNTIINKLDKSDPIAITFLDLAKAFDTVDHKLLLKKLYNYGIRGNAHQLISSYLSGRFQKVRVNGVYSESLGVSMGIPQGTILGPLLFILYVNDLLTGMPEGEIVSFADDTAVVATGKTWTQIEQKANNQLKIISVWLALNKLSLNIDKTVYITFGNYCNSVPLNFNLQLNNSNIQRAENCKYLGVYIDYKINWGLHIEKIIKKTKYLIFIFHKLAELMQQKTLMIIYYALFHSVISYGIIAWGGAFPTQLIILERLQTKILKIINKNKFVTNNYPCNIHQQYALESLLYHYDSLKSAFIMSNSKTRYKSL